MAANCRVTLKLGPMALEAGAPLAKNASEVPPQTGHMVHRGDAEVAELIHWSSQRPLRLCGEYSGRSEVEPR
jgi:hypothetical protein